MKISDFSVNHPVPVAAFYIVIFVLGILSLTRIGLDLFPDLDYPVVAVMARYPGVAPEEMEKLVTEHLEAAAASADGVRRVKSVSLQGACAIMVEFDWESDLNTGAQDVRNQVELALDFLPREVERPVVLKFDMDLLPVIYYGIYSDGDRDLRTLRKYVKDVFEKRLVSLPGVASVSVQGGLEREIEIRANRDRLKATGISLDQMVDLISGQNIDNPGGYLDVGRNELIVRTKGKFISLDAIRDTVLKSDGERTVYVKDVADVVDGHEEIRNHSRTNKVDSVLMTVTKEPGSNSVQVVDTIRAEMAEIQKALPSDIQVVHIYNSSRLIRGAIEQLSTSALWGFSFAMVILFFFLLSYRTTLTLMFSMMFAVVSTFIAVYLTGETLNIMTLSGVALGIGLIVDNSIVVVENIFRHIEKGTPPAEAAKTGTKEVGLAISASTLTTVVVFLPMALSTGVTGILTRSLGITVVFAILASLIVALTLVPTLGARVFRVKRKSEEFRVFENVKDIYSRAIYFVLYNRGKTLLGTFAVFLVCIFIMLNLGTEYIPKLDETDGTAVIKLEPGLSLAETDAFMREMEDVVASLPEFVSMEAMVGRSEVSTIDMVFGVAASDVHEASMYFELLPRKERRRTYREICDDIYSRLNIREGVTVFFMDTMDWFLGGGDMPVEVRLFGSDLDELDRIGKEVESIVADVEGIVDLDNSMKPGKPELQIYVDREKASKLGISVATISSTIENALVGYKAGKYRIDGDEYDIRVRYTKTDRDDPEDVSHFLIPSSNGGLYYLHEVADVVKGLGPARIHRESQRRAVILSANVSGRDLGSVMEEIRTRLEPIALPDGYYITYGGGYKDMVEMQNAILLAFILVVLLVYLVMCAQFESFFQPLAILFSVPMSLIGVSLILYATGITLSLMSFIGILMLVGITVNNAIVLIDYVNQLRRKGMEKTAAIIEGGKTRLRPIIMSSSTTILALLPLSILKGDGCEIFAPISVVLLGGLITSTLLTLLIIPAWYSLLDDLYNRIFHRAL